MAETRIKTFSDISYTDLDKKVNNFINSELVAEPQKLYFETVLPIQSPNNQPIREYYNYVCHVVYYVNDIR